MKEIFDNILAWFFLMALLIGGALAVNWVIDQAPITVTIGH